MGYLIPKPFTKKNSSDTIQPLTRGGDKKVHTFPKGINPNVNVIPRLVFELANYDCNILICRIINDPIIKTQEDFFINICTSHFIVRVRKGLFRVCV